jgi:hypothetical protein
MDVETIARPTPPYNTRKHGKRKRSLDSALGIATGYGLDDRGIGVRVSVGSRIFSASSKPALGPTQPPIQWISGVKRPGSEADLSQLVPRSRKRAHIHPLPHTFSWRSAYLVKHRGQLYFMEKRIMPQARLESETPGSVPSNTGPPSRPGWLCY